MWLRRLLALAAVTSAAARFAVSSSPHKSALSLRGGLVTEELEEEAATIDEDFTGILDEEETKPNPTTELEKKALTRDEIVAKLNHIPVFAIVNEDGQMVGLQDKDTSVFACCWFTDPTEAKGLLEATKQANPDKGLKLVVAGMGGAFAACHGFADEPGDGAEGLKTTEDDQVELRLQGTHGLVAELKPKLVGLLEKQGIDAGSWTLPIFMCEELQSRAICPVFLHPADLAATWEKAGRDPEKLPENLTVMDLRMLVAAMRTDTNAWSLVQFVGSAKAAELAMEVGKELQDGEA